MSITLSLVNILSIHKTAVGCQLDIVRTLADCLYHVTFTIMRASPTWW